MSWPYVVLFLFIMFSTEVTSTDAYIYYQNICNALNNIENVTSSIYAPICILCTTAYYEMNYTLAKVFFPALICYVKVLVNR